MKLVDGCVGIHYTILSLSCWYMFEMFYNKKFKEAILQTNVELEKCYWRNAMKEKQSPISSTFTA